MFPSHCPQVTEEELRRSFIGHGKMTEVKIAKVPGTTNKSRGFGFIQYESTENSASAQEAMNGKSVMGK